MTKEEYALHLLNQLQIGASVDAKPIIPQYEFAQALGVAIQALEQQTCENINEDYADCDQFKCSECQIELQDWHRVERDDDGEVSYHEYTFRYCPHCGRRIKYDE